MPRDKQMSCNNWFYYNCLTTEGSTNCSKNIDKIPCEKSFCGYSTYYSKSNCQKCSDFENCFNKNTNCKSWDNSTCPFGILNQDYMDSSRVDFVEFKPNVLAIDHNDVILYKCSLFSDSNNSLFVFKNQTLKNKIVINDILMSDQVDGIMHKIDSIYDLNYDFTLINANPASIEEVIEYSDFKNADYISEMDFDLKREQLPDDDFFDYMKNYTNITMHHIDPQFNTYKCAGKTYESILDSTLITEYTTFIVMKATTVTRSFRVNDLLRSEMSNGFLERVL
jgi:hypothetical protein